MRQQIAGAILFGKVKSLFCDEEHCLELPKLHQLRHSLFHCEKKADISGNGPDISGAVSHFRMHDYK
jgi:hypothetical protein